MEARNENPKAPAESETADGVTIDELLDAIIGPEPEPDTGMTEDELWAATAGRISEWLQKQIAPQDTMDPFVKWSQHQQAQVLYEYKRLEERDRFAEEQRRHFYGYDPS